MNQAEVTQSNPTIFDSTILDEFDHPVFIVDDKFEKILQENSNAEDKIQSLEAKENLLLMAKGLYGNESGQGLDITKHELNITKYSELKIKRLSRSNTDYFICHLSSPKFEFERKNESLFESFKEAEIGLKFGTWYYNIEENEIFWSKGMFEIFGINPEEEDSISIETYLEYVHPDDVEYILDQNKFFIENGYQNGDYQHRIITPSGEIKILSANAKAMNMEDSRVTHMMGYVSDITTLKEAENSLSMTIVELEKTNYLLKNFASFASHDLQEPLRKIQVFADRFATSTQDKLDEKSLVYWGKMRKSIARLHSLMQGILNLSSLSKKEIATQPIELNSIIERVKEDFELKIKEVNAVVNFDLPQLDMDPVQAYQLFQNLINNSLKFHRPNVPVEIQIKSSELSADELKLPGLDKNFRYVKISFSDNGIGFGENQSHEMFVAFTQLNDKKAYEGNGIGLAICERIVLNHKGLIFAKNNDPNGAVFEIYLPTPTQF